MTPSDTAAEPDHAHDTVRAEFDADFYLTEQPDVAAAGVDAWEHYNDRGWREGRNPTSWFVIADYLAVNPDILQAGAEPFAHYVLHGRAEGRPGGDARAMAPAVVPVADLSTVEAEFDADFYVAANPALDLTPHDAWAHYRDRGWRDLLDPTRWFSTRHYLETNADVVVTGINPFVHFVLHGRREGRDLEHGLGFRYDIIQRAEGFERHVQALTHRIPDREASPDADLTTLLDFISGSSRVHVTVSHDDFTQSLGGVQLCLRIEGAAMRAEGAAHIHLFPGRALPVIDLEREAPRIGVLINDVLAGYFDASLVATSLETLCAGRTTTLAIHSLIAHRASDIVDVAERLKAERTFYWLHDFSSLCANYALMRNDAIFCGAPPPESMACEICIYGARRQVQLAEHLALFDRVKPTVVAPSESALTLWRARFPAIERRAVVHPHATFVPAKQRRVTRVDTDGPRPLRVGFLGMPTSHKGWPVFDQLARRFIGDPRYSFHHLAKETDPGLGLPLTVVVPTPQNATPMIDAVRDLELDVAVLWSLWPETFCFAAFEAVAGGAAILTNPDSGNVQDMVGRLGCGLVLEDDHALSALFVSGEVTRLSRARRQVKTQGLAYSRMTADLILGGAA